MNERQAIQNPLGVTVFGSAVLRVEPDIASLRFTVSRLEQHPKEAFAATRQATQKVRDYLVKAGIEDVNPDQLRGYEQHQSRVSPSVQEEETLRAFDPSSIVVRGAVIVVFALAE